MLFKTNYHRAVLPMRRTPGAAGYDVLHCRKDIEIKTDGSYVLVNTGIRLNNFPPNCYLQIKNKSRKALFEVYEGVIDSDYTQDILFRIKVNSWLTTTQQSFLLGKLFFTIYDNTSLAQLVVIQQMVMDEDDTIELVREATDALKRMGDVPDGAVVEAVEEEEVEVVSDAECIMAVEVEEAMDKIIVCTQPVQSPSLIVSISPAIDWPFAKNTSVVLLLGGVGCGKSTVSRALHKIKPGVVKMNYDLMGVDMLHDVAQMYDMALSRPTCNAQKFERMQAYIAHEKDMLAMHELNIRNIFHYQMNTRDDVFDNHTKPVFILDRSCNDIPAFSFAIMKHLRCKGWATEDDIARLAQVYEAARASMSDHLMIMEKMFVNVAILYVSCSPDIQLLRMRSRVGTIAHLDLKAMRAMEVKFFADSLTEREVLEFNAVYHEEMVQAYQERMIEFINDDTDGSVDITRLLTAIRTAFM